MATPTTFPIPQPFAPTARTDKLAAKRIALGAGFVVAAQGAFDAGVAGPKRGAFVVAEISSPDRNRNRNRSRTGVVTGFESKPD
jgi:hypothetical protein